MNIKVDDRRLFLAGKPVRLFAGAVHYWRLDPRNWEKILGNVAQLGFSCVQTYVPWSVHEIERGRFDFGERDPRKDLPKFISLCHRLGLKMFLRPGPHINAELTYFGYPKRIFAHDEMLAKGPDDTVVVIPAPPRGFPAPSYASEAFYAEVDVWMAAVSKIIAANLYPAGPVIGVQPDNEMAMFFRTSVFDQDYSEGALSLYREFVRERLRGNEFGLRERYRTDVGFDKITPPREFSVKHPRELPRYFDWVDFHTYLMKYAIRRIKDQLESHGVRGCFWFHNYPPGNHGNPPFDVQGAEEIVHAQGADLYQRRTEYHFVRRIAGHLAGTSRFPMLPELCCGSTMWIKSLLPEDIIHTTMVSLMHGIKSFSAYMLVERDRWYGSAITSEGEYREPLAQFYRKLFADLANVKFELLHKHSDVLLLVNREYAALDNLTYLFDPVPILFLDDAELLAESYCLEDDFGFEEAPQVFHGRIFRTWYYALARNHFAFDLSDTASDPQRWKKYSCVILPTLSPMSSDLQAKLVNFVRDGGTLVIGWKFPSHGWSGESLEMLAQSAKAKPKIDEIRGCDVYEIGAGRVISVQKLSELKTISMKDDKALRAIYRSLEQILEDLGVPKTLDASDPSVETALHKGPLGDVVFVSNTTSVKMQFSVTIPADAIVKDISTGEFITKGPVLGGFLMPHEVRMYKIEGLR
ncbi:MAG: beta-galactosidase [Planctomycetes bacterium]|nr:beta-galactosidase [Planctomycetota bacterium]